MPNDPAQDRLPGEALDAFLDGVLADVKNPADPETLSAIRTAFRRRIPLHLRSYAAALLIMRAAGLVVRGAQGSAPPRPAPKPPAPKATAPKPGATAKPARSPLATRPAREEKPPREAREPRGTREPREAREPREPRPDLGPVTPLFVSAGKRQRLKPGELRSIISDKTGIPTERLGRVRLFDNYCFIDVPEPQAQEVIAQVNGIEFAGKPLEINIAKKRGEDRVEEPAPDA